MSHSADSLVQAAERIARERIAPRAARHDEEASFPFDDYADLHAHGLVGLMVPRRYGGQEADPWTYARVVKALAAANGSTALTFNMHSTVVQFIAALGSEEQKERYLRAVAEEGRLCATITSEPSSSLRGRFHLETRATRVPGGYRINGTKHFCSLSEAASFYFVWACLDGLPASDGLINVIVERDNPGVALERTWNSAAMRATSSHTLHFRDCFVPESAALGRPGQIIEDDLGDRFMLGYAAVYLGLAEGALEYTVRYANATRFKPDDVPISRFGPIQTHVGEMAVRVESARLMLERAARACAGGDARERARWLHQAKYASTETAAFVTDRAVRVCGGRALLRQHPLERYLRDARAGIIMPPHNDRCLETIGQVHLGFDVGGGFINR